MRWWLCAVGVASSSCASFRQCDDIAPERLASLPERLSATGLFEDLATETLATGVRPYEPRFKLWSDGAEKRRWVYLPERSVIDSSDPDFWSWPQGTRLWKEFTRDGVRVETRILSKEGPTDNDWVAQGYLWEEDGSDAIAVPEGQRDASGTDHDVPAAADCWACHGGHRSRVLGISAVQLAWEAEGLDMNELLDEGRLTETPPVAALPGDELDQKALGYLHANCSHCHNQDRPVSTGARCYDPNNPLEFLLRTDKLASVKQTPTYRSGIVKVMLPGDGAGSDVVVRMSTNFSLEDPQMPPIGNEVIDQEGVDLLRRWIDRL